MSSLGIKNRLIFTFIYGDVYYIIMSIIVENQQNYSNSTNDIVSNFINNAVSSIILANKIIFSFIDAWTPLFPQVKDNSGHMSDIGINAAKTFEQDTMEIGKIVKENTNSNVNATTKLINSNVQLSTSFMQRVMRAMKIASKNIISGVTASFSFFNLSPKFLKFVGG